MEIYSISLFLLLSYLILIARYGMAWIRLPDYINKEVNTKTGISILIPSRNEEKNIASCLSAISKQDFPQDCFEVIVIDDNSEDKTSEKAHDFFKKNPQIKGQLLSLAEAGHTGKKEAITLGMQTALHPLVVTTDADCLSPPTWLKTIVSYYEAHGGKLIAAPVTFKQSSGIIQQLQELEFLGLQVVAAGGISLKEPVLCNGANLCYDRAAFLKVGGYSNNSNILSGDDLFIMQKINKEYPGEVKFIKSKRATVETTASRTVSQFFGQRKRWVSKVVSIPDWRTILVSLIVYLTNLSLVANFVFWLTLPDFSGSFLIITFGVKALIDFLFLHLSASYFNRLKLMKVFVLAEILNVVYVTVIGVFGNIGKYNWKGRTSDQRSFVSNNS